MTRRTFTDSHLVEWAGLTFEVVAGRDVNRRAQLDSLREEVLRVAAVSRGWDDPGSIAHFRRTFKIGPMYEASGLMLVYKNDELVGLAGTVNDWTVGSGSVVHLCSLGLLPQVQRRGLLQVFMSLLWIASLQRPGTAADLARGALYTTAITQSPYIVGFMQQVADIFPSPTRIHPRPDEIDVARAVIARFDPDVSFDAATFVLRNECEFRYRRMPLSLDRRITRMCAERLRYEQGDVFVVVGAVNAERLGRFLERQKREFQEPLGALLAKVCSGTSDCTTNPLRQEQVNDVNV
ncbi:hypothetical protein [Bradyrhizobium sp. Ai1a-2]|uniref:hypothetical protein n=1 Tax=Bradyrhizobium sp. Ai1a-2 TaxID=196490 RepID=UPI00040C3300|nr:hypothetical protein [Bradyrhizobium sp. Ai1a-2]